MLPIFFFPKYQPMITKPGTQIIHRTVIYKRYHDRQSPPPPRRPRKQMSIKLSCWCIYSGYSVPVNVSATTLGSLRQVYDVRYCTLRDDSGLVNIVIWSR